MKKIIIGAVVIIVIAAAGYLLLTRSSDQEVMGDNTNVEEFTFAEAHVDEIEIEVLETFPLEVRVTAKGSLSDACTEIDEIVTEQIDDIFFTSITTKRPKEAMCAQVVQDFEETFSLDVEGLEKGIYTVDVNGITDIFELEFDNTASKG